MNSIEKKELFDRLSRLEKTLERVEDNQMYNRRKTDPRLRLGGIVNGRAYTGLNTRSWLQRSNTNN